MSLGRCGGVHPPSTAAARGGGEPPPQAFGSAAAAPGGGDPPPTTRGNCCGAGGKDATIFDLYFASLTKTAGSGNIKQTVVTKTFSYIGNNLRATVTDENCKRLGEFFALLRICTSYSRASHRTGKLQLSCQESCSIIQSATLRL